ncbi:MAG: efflux RND transporter periplasmic adaptor subunit [Planctomycetales bacterium]
MLDLKVESTRSGIPARRWSIGWKRVLAWVGIGVLGVGVWGREHFLAPSHSAPEVNEEKAAQKEEGAAEKREVRLSPEKVSAGKIGVATCVVREIQSEISVPGRVEYDARHWLELRAPVSGVVKQLFVQAGDQVKAGAKLGVIDASEIGLARADLQRQQGELELREREYRRAIEVEENVRALRDMFEKGRDAEEIEKLFHEKALGEYREKLIGNYSQMKLAQKLMKNIKGLASEGVTSTKVQQERQSQYEVAASAFESAYEQAAFNVEQAKKKADSERQYAQNLTRVSEQKLRSLAGNFSLGDENWKQGDKLTELTLNAPFAGTIEKREVMEGSRVNSLETLFTLADKEHLWVSIEIRENQWEALQVRKGETFRLTTPALGGKSFPCRVEYVGGAVNSQTRSVPIVAMLENHEKVFKPGMLAWVNLPEGKPRRCLAVPQSCIVRHEGKTFVFVEKEAGDYLFQEVKLGTEAEGFVEVKSGVPEGAKVVSAGTFLLKSELLLESEEYWRSAGTLRGDRETDPLRPAERETVKDVA